MEIRIENITKSFNGIDFIREISFVAYPKEIVGVLATQGSGKSLLLDLIRGKIHPDKGLISFIEKNTVLTHSQICTKIGYLSAENPLYDEMTIFDFLTFIAKLYKMPKYLRMDRVKNLIKMCGLSSSQYKRIKELSLGYRQKVGLAQALVHNPSVLLLDEPVKKLDPVQSREIYNLIRDLGKEQTVIISSSHMSDMENMCDSMLVLSGGSVLAKGTVESLQEQVKNSSVLKVGIGGASNEAARIEIKSISGVQSITQEKNKLFNVHVVNKSLFAKELFNLCVKNNWYITSLSSTEQSLEDIFKQLRQK